jgi:formiminoglutamase
MKIVKIPFSMGAMGKNDGCEKAPDKIIENLKEIELNENNHKVNFEVSEPELNLDNLDKLQEQLSELEGDFFIGGDHSITYGLFNGMKGEDKGLIIFDAHLDMDVSAGSLTHEDFVRSLIENNKIKPENLIIIGVRKYWKSEIEFLKENNVKVYWMKNLFENNLGDVCDEIMEQVSKFDSLYISVDIDSLDPTFAPGSGYLVPGGLNSRSLLYFIKRFKKLKNLKRVDLVEINPDKDVNDMTSLVGAKIVSEFIF